MNPRFELDELRCPGAVVPKTEFDSILPDGYNARFARQATDWFSDLGEQQDSRPSPQPLSPQKSPGSPGQPFRSVKSLHGKCAPVSFEHPAPADVVSDPSLLQVSNPT
nr:hypothetical protein StreXyl84_77920 [Streptomyces sp. Xyl84]